MRSNLQKLSYSITIISQNLARLLRKSLRKYFDLHNSIWTLFLLFYFFTSYSNWNNQSFQLDTHAESNVILIDQGVFVFKKFCTMQKLPRNV